MEVKPLPLEKLSEVDSIVFLEDVLAKRYDEEGYLELLVKWMHCPSHENSWVSYGEFVEHYPHFKLEDKLDFKGESIDNYQRAYFRKKSMKNVNVEVKSSGGKGAETLMQTEGLPLDEEAMTLKQTEGLPLED